MDGILRPSLHPASRTSWVVLKLFKMDNGCCCHLSKLLLCRRPTVATRLSKSLPCGSIMIATCRRECVKVGFLKKGFYYDPMNEFYHLFLKFCNKDLQVLLPS